MRDLREALEALVGEAWDDGNAVGLDGYVGPNRGAGDVDPEAERARERMLNRAATLLAAHPVEPAGPVIRCTMPGCSSLGQEITLAHTHSVQVEITDEVLAVAAQASYNKIPHVYPWSDLTENERSPHWERARAALEAAAPLLGPRPMLDRRQIEDSFIRAEHKGVSLLDAWEAGHLADAVMEMARPMPTREQLYATLDGFTYGDASRWAAADTVLALLKGTD